MNAVSLFLCAPVVRNPHQCHTALRFGSPTRVRIEMVQKTTECIAVLHHACMLVDCKSVGTLGYIIQISHSRLLTMISMQRRTLYPQVVIFWNICRYYAVQYPRLSSNTECPRKPELQQRYSGGGERALACRRRSLLRCCV